MTECRILRAASGAALVLAVGLTGACGSGGTSRSSDTSRPPGSGTARLPATAPGTGFAAIPEVVRRVEPSVVTVLAGESLGSGIVYRPGVVVTNAHVVGEVRDVQLQLADGTRLGGRVQALDTVTDLAVIRPERQDLPPVPFAQDLPQVGELVIALGSPLGFENSASAGIVSGLGRVIPGSAGQNRALVDLIQTDASISPGNSGGALVDGQGRVVGVNEAYIPPSAGAVSLGFAIPAATVTDVVDELLAQGQARHPFLGVTTADLTPEIARALGLGVNQGVLVREVVASGPADSAGIRPGDVVTSMAGRRVAALEDFLSALRTLEPGQRVRVEYHRDGRSLAAEVTLGELDAPPR